MKKFFKGITGLLRTAGCSTRYKLVVIGQNVTVIPVMSGFQRVRKFDRNCNEFDSNIDSKKFLSISRQLEEGE